MTTNNYNTQRHTATDTSICMYSQKLDSGTRTDAIEVFHRGVLMTAIAFEADDPRMDPWDVLSVHILDNAGEDPTAQVRRRNWLDGDGSAYVEVSVSKHRTVFMPMNVAEAIVAAVAAANEPVA